MLGNQPVHALEFCPEPVLGSVEALLGGLGPTECVCVCVREVVRLHLLGTSKLAQHSARRATEHSKTQHSTEQHIWAQHSTAQCSLAIEPAITELQLATLGCSG